MKNNLPPYADLQTLQGLSENEAAVRLQAEGFNELPSAKPRSLFAIAWEVVREPMFLLLVACGAIYLILREGDRVSADAWLGQSTNLAVDESLLTGESVPVRKQAGEGREAKPAAMARPGGDDTPFIFSGTLVVQGQGIAEVQAIADLCHFTRPQTQELARQIDGLAQDALRVLGVARARFRRQDNLPGEQHDFPFDFIGLIGLADPVRPTVPEAIREPLFSRRSIGFSVRQGMVALAIVLAVFGLYYSRGGSETEARAMCYTTLIIANLGLILSNRSRIQSLLNTLRIPNGAMWWVLGGATLFLSLVLTVPALRDIFRFAPLHPLDIAFCLAAGTASIVGFELIKYWNRRQTKPIL